MAMELDGLELLYNAAAHFMAMEKYPGTPREDGGEPEDSGEPEDAGLLSAIWRDGYEGMEAVCWALEALSRQGALLQREMGMEAQEPIKASKAMVEMTLPELLRAKRMVFDAVVRGMHVEDEKGEVDEVLAELEKKTDGA